MNVATRVAACLASALLLVGCSATTPTTTAPVGTAAPAASTTPATTDPTTPSATPTATETASTAGSQTVTEACLKLNAAMLDAAKTMQSSMSTIGTDPKKALKALQKFEKVFASAVAEVNNDKVKAQATKALTSTKKLVAMVDAVIKNPRKATGAQKVITNYQTQMTKLGTVCSGS